MSHGKIIIISGPSGSGKTTLYKKLLANKKFKNILVKSISITTRPKRINEKNGRDYLFISKEMFLYKKRTGHFLESEKVFDNYYGTPKKGVFDLLKKGKNVLLCIDVKGAQTVSRLYPRAVKIFVTAPSFSMLKERLLKRESENKKSLWLRLKTAKEELKQAKFYNYVIVNDNLKKAYKQVERIVLKELGVGTVSTFF